MDIETVEFGRARSAAPSEPPPSADAPYEDRAAWSEQYVTWLIQREKLSGTLPPDVRATHLYEIEFVSCVEDPERYVREVEMDTHPVSVH